MKRFSLNLWASLIFLFLEQLKGALPDSLYCDWNDDRLANKVKFIHIKIQIYFFSVSKEFLHQHVIQH